MDITEDSNTNSKNKIGLGTKTHEEGGGATMNSNESEKNLPFTKPNGHTMLNELSYQSLHD
jgi:hypothetical protein